MTSSKDGKPFRDPQDFSTFTHDIEPRRGRKRQRSLSPSPNHHPSLPSGESTCFRGRRRNRSTSPFIPGSVAASRNTSAGLRSRSCSPRVRYFMAISGSGSFSNLRWTGERRRSQSPSRSPRGWRDSGSGLGEGKRRRHRTRSRSRGRLWTTSWEAPPTRAYEEASLKKAGVSLSGLRMEVKCDDQDEGIGGCDED